MLLAIDRSIQPASYSIFDDDGREQSCVTGCGMPSRLPAGVTRIAVAVGPGSFSGIRSALAFAQGFALPVGAQVIGIPTPAAIWRAYTTEHPEVKEGVVIGDARRGKLWVWKTGSVGILPALIDTCRRDACAPGVIITPDHKRLSALFPDAIPAPPISRAVGELALEGVCLPPLPIYLSEAV